VVLIQSVERPSEQNQGFHRKKKFYLWIVASDLSQKFLAFLPDGMS
jgi:hypothetical protein